MPDLLDDGFISDDKVPTSYVGWRDGSFYVPVSLLKQGVNTVQFSDEDDVPDGCVQSLTAAESEQPLAIKDMVLQLNYQPARPESRTDSASTLWNAPSAPIFARSLIFPNPPNQHHENTRLFVAAPQTRPAAASR